MYIHSNDAFLKHMDLRREYFFQSYFPELGMNYMLKRENNMLPENSKTCVAST